MNVRHNYWAILVASLAYFFLGAAWFTALMNPWLQGIERTKESIIAHNTSGPAVPYIVAFLAAVVIAVALSYFIQATGPQTAGRGVKVAILLWVGFVLTTWATEYFFEARTLQILAINTGYPLVGMVVEGAIVGGWKKK
jgi:uncharacterized protein DUF1761